MHMDNLYNNGKLFRASYSEKKLLHGVSRTYGRVELEEIIRQELKSNKNRTK